MLSALARKHPPKQPATHAADSTSAADPAPPSGRTANPQDVLDETGSATRLLRYAGAIPYIGGVAQSYYGFKELRVAGSVPKTDSVKLLDIRVNGGADTLCGVGGMATNFSNLPLYMHLMRPVSHNLLALFGPLAGSFCLLTNLVDGTRDIFNGIQTKDPSVVAIGLVKMGGGALSFAGAISAQPALWLAGNCITAGAVGYQNRESLKKIYDGAVYFAHHPGEGLKALETGLQQASHLVLKTVQGWLAAKPPPAQPLGA